MISYHLQEKNKFLTENKLGYVYIISPFGNTRDSPTIFPGRRVLSDVLKPGTLGKIFLKRLKTVIKTLVNDCSMDY